MTDTKTVMQYTMKGAIMAGTYVALDKVVLKKSSTTKSMAISFCAIAAGSIIAQVVASQFLKENTLFGLLPNARSIESQAAEVAASVVAGIAADKYLLNNSYSTKSIDMKTDGLLIASDLLAEVAIDILFMKKTINPFD